MTPQDSARATGILARLVKSVPIRRERMERAAAVALSLLSFVSGLAALLLLVAGTERVEETINVEARHAVIAFTSRLTSPSIETADAIPTWPRASNPLGVNTFLEQEPDPEVRRRAMSMIRDAGIGWIRQEFPWKDLEQQARGDFRDRKSGQSTWEKYDDIVDLAEEYGVRVIARLSTSPAWSHPSHNGEDLVPPDDYADFAHFSRAVATRYRGRIAVYQVWNEPNLHREWGERPVNAGDYVRLLRAAHDAIRRADPEALVMAAALAPTIEESDRALSDLVFLQRMYDAGARDAFDVMGVQAYGLRHGPDDRRLDFGDVNLSRVLRIREIMVRNGDGSKQMWASEFGWNSAPVTLRIPNDYGRVSERLQARYTVRALERARDEWPWMGVMAIWFFKRADAAEFEQPWFYFHMVGPRFQVRPVYSAVADYSTQRGLRVPSSLERRPA